jgi:hypothetical protein
MIEIIAPMIFAIILTLTIGGVILLKPIANKLGALLEAVAKDKSGPQLSDELTHIRDLLETTNARLTLLEERQDFSDALLHGPDRRNLRLGGGLGQTTIGTGEATSAPGHAPEAAPASEAPSPPPPRREGGMEGESA